MDADLYVHGEESGDDHASHAHNEDAHFVVVQETSDNLKGEDEVLSVTAAVVYLSVDGSHTKGLGADFELHVIEELPPVATTSATICNSASLNVLPAHRRQPQSLALNRSPSRTSMGARYEQTQKLSGPAGGDLPAAADLWLRHLYRSPERGTHVWSTVSISRTIMNIEVVVKRAAPFRKSGTQSGRWTPCPCGTERRRPGDRATRSGTITLDQLRAPVASSKHPLERKVMPHPNIHSRAGGGKGGGGAGEGASEPVDLWISSRA